MLLFSSEEGQLSFAKLFGISGPTHRQLEAPTKTLDGTNVLVILPTGAGETVILVNTVFGLNRMIETPGEFVQRSTRFPIDLTVMVVVYPTDCLEEELCVYVIRDTLSDAPGTVCQGCPIHKGRTNNFCHQRQNSRTRGR